jgi:hypothetical protein
MQRFDTRIDKRSDMVWSATESHLRTIPNQSYIATTCALTKLNIFYNGVYHLDFTLSSACCSLFSLSVKVGGSFLR